MWQWGGLLIGLALLAAAVAGCGARGEERPAAEGRGRPAAEEREAGLQAPSYPLAVTDDLGRQLTLARRPERIVSLAPSNTEILFALGLGERVVGVTDYCDYPPEAKAKEKVGGFRDPSIEKIVALKPDLVLATGGVQRETVAQLEKLGVPVFVLDPRTVDGVLGSIRTVARLAGIPAAGEPLAESLQRRIDAVRARTAGLPEDARPAVFYEVWPDKLRTAGPGSFIHDLIELAGGRNVAADTGQPYPEFSVESLVAADPAVIITPFEQTARDLAQGRRPGWQGIRAVREGRVVVVDQDLVSRPGPRLVDGLEAFARAIHPELFGGER